MCFFFFLLVIKFFVLFFFFSSRRRHTRWNCDWSSDVCSSDLRSAGIRRGRFRSAPCRCAWDRRWGGRRSLRGRARLQRGRDGLSVSSYAPLQDDESINETTTWRLLRGALLLARLLLAPQLRGGEVAGEIEVVLDGPRHQVRVRLAVDQAENATLLGRHARIARLPRLVACLGALIDPIRCRHAPSPGKARFPLNIGPRR